MSNTKWNRLVEQKSDQHHLYTEYNSYHEDKIINKLCTHHYKCIENQLNTTHSDISIIITLWFPNIIQSILTCVYVLPLGINNNHLLIYYWTSYRNSTTL